MENIINPLTRVLNPSNRNQLAFSQVGYDFSISDLLPAFYQSRVSSSCRDKTIVWYKEKLDRVQAWLEYNGIEYLSGISPAVLRAFLMEYSTDHTQSGVHCYYRSIKAFLNWVWYEYDLEYPNPIKKIKCATGTDDPIHGVDPADLDKLISATALSDYPERDKAIIAVLSDTGIRKSSLCNIRKCDVDIINGSIRIVHSKNHKQFTAYLGRIARKIVRKYMRTIESLPDNSLLWVSVSGDPLTPCGIREILRRTSRRAGVPEYSFHDYRRYFALASYHNGADVYAVSSLLNHSGVEVTKRYLALSESDKQEIHNTYSPLDNRK